MYLLIIGTNTFTETTYSKKILCKNGIKRHEENNPTDIPHRDKSNDLNRSCKDSDNTRPSVDSERPEKTVSCISERKSSELTKCNETPLVQKICPIEKSTPFHQTNLHDKTVKCKSKKDDNKCDKSTKNSYEHLGKKSNGGIVPCEPCELYSKDSTVVENTNIGNPLRCDTLQHKIFNSVKTDGSTNDNDVSKCDTIETKILDVVKNIRRVTEELFQVKQTSDYSAIPEKSTHPFKQNDDIYKKQCDVTHVNRDVALQMSENSGKNSNGSNMNGGNDLNAIDHLTCDDTTDTKCHKRYNADTSKAKDIICKQNSSSINDTLHKKKLKIPTFLEEIVQAKIIPVKKRTQSSDHVQNTSTKYKRRSHSVSECSEEHSRNIGNRSKYVVKDCSRDTNVRDKCTSTIERNSSRKFEIKRSISESKEKQYTKYEGKFNYRNTDMYNRRQNHERHDANDKGNRDYPYSNKDKYRKYSRKDHFTSYNMIGNCGNYTDQSYSRNRYFNNRRRYGNIGQYRNCVENNIHRNSNENDNFRKSDGKYNENHQQKVTLKNDHKELNQQNYSMEEGAIKLKQTVDAPLERQCDSTQIICSKQDNFQASSPPNTEKRSISGKISSLNGSSTIFPTHVSKCETELHLNDNPTSKCEGKGNSKDEALSTCEGVTCHSKDNPTSICEIKGNSKDEPLSKCKIPCLSKDNPTLTCDAKGHTKYNPTSKCDVNGNSEGSPSSKGETICSSKETFSSVCDMKDHSKVFPSSKLTNKATDKELSKLDDIHNPFDDKPSEKCVEKDEMCRSTNVETREEISTVKYIAKEEISTSILNAKDDVHTAKCVEKDEKNTNKCVAKENITTAKCVGQQEITGSTVNHVPNDIICTDECVEMEGIDIIKCVSMEETNAYTSVENKINTAKYVEKEELSTAKCVEKEELSTAKCEETDELSTAESFEKEELGTAKCVEDEELSIAKCVEKEELSTARCVDNAFSTSTNAKCDPNYTSQAMSEEKCLSIKTSQSKVEENLQSTENKTVVKCKTMSPEETANSSKCDTKVPEIHSNKCKTAQILSNNSKSISPGKNHGSDVTKQENTTKVMKELKQITHKDSIPPEFIIPESDTNDKKSYDEVVETNSINDSCTHHLHEEAISVMKPIGSSNCCKLTNTNGGHQDSSNAIVQIGNSINAESKLLKTIKEKMTTLLKKSVSESRNSDTLKTKKRLASFNNVGKRRKYAKAQCKKNVKWNKKESTNAIDLIQINVDTKVNAPLPRERKRKIELLDSTCTFTKEAKCPRLIKDTSQLKQSRQSGLSKKSNRNTITDSDTCEKLKCERRNDSDMTSPQKEKRERRDVSNMTSPQKEKREGRDDSSITPPKQLKCERRYDSDNTPPQKLKCERRDVSNNTPPRRVWTEREKPRRRKWYDTNEGYDEGRHRYSCSRNSEHESYYNDRTSTMSTREDTSTRTWPSVSSVVTKPMPNTRSLEGNEDVRFGHERCFNAVHVYAFNCLKRFYNKNKHIYRIPVEEFRYQLKQQLKRNFDRYLYDVNDPIYSNMGPQPRFVSEDVMITSIAETIINPHTFADRERQFHEFDEIVGYLGYNIPCYWCEVDFRYGQFFRAFPVLDPIGYRDDTMYCQ